MVGLDVRLCVLSFRQNDKKHAVVARLLHDLQSVARRGGVNIACKSEIVPDISSKYFVGQRVRTPHDKEVGAAANEKSSLQCLLY